MINEVIVELPATRLRLIEEVVCALIRSIDPFSREAIVFSRISAEFKAVAGCRFTDLFSIKPVEFSAQYMGGKLVFSRDHNDPPLLQCARVVGPWEPVKTPTQELLSWAQENGLKGVDTVDFALAGRRFGDLHGVILTWLRTRATLTPQRMLPSRGEVLSQKVHPDCRYVRQPNDTCRIGSVHTGVYHRLAENGRGVVVLFTGADDAGISGYLPAASLPPEVEISSLISKSGEFVIAGRKMDKILLEPAKPAEFPRLSAGVLQGTIYRVSAMETEIRLLKEMLLALDKSLVAEAIPLAEKVLAKSLSKIVSSAIKTWNGRGLTVRGIDQRGASIFHFPSEIEIGPDDKVIPYGAVMQAIKALQQEI